MGLFDYLRCNHPDVPDGEYQTKSVPWPWLRRIEIRGDGTLWREDFDTEDRSDPNAEGLMAMCGMMTPINKRWVQMADFTGEVAFRDGERRFSAYFFRGQLREIHELED